MVGFNFWKIMSTGAWEFGILVGCMLSDSSARAVNAHVRLQCTCTLFMVRFAEFWIQFFDLFSYFFKWIFEFQSPMICRMLSNQIYFFLNINYLLREPVLQSKCSISELVYLTLFGMGEGIFFIPLDWHFLAEFLSKLFILFWRWKLTLIGLFWQTCPACWAFYKMHLGGAKDGHFFSWKCCCKKG